MANRVHFQSLRFAAGRWAGIAPLVLLLGCGTPQATSLPPTYPVNGKVLLANGQPASGGHIEFTPKLSGMKFMATIQSNGTFSARTVGADGAADGAPEGTYTAVIVPSLTAGPEEQHLGQFHAIQEEFEVSATGENNFTIRLPPPAP